MSLNHICKDRKKMKEFLKDEIYFCSNSQIIIELNRHSLGHLRKEVIGFSHQI